MGYAMTKQEVIEHAWWLKTFRNTGYDLVGFSYSMGAIKKHWTDSFPYGNGFFIMTSKE